MINLLIAYDDNDSELGDYFEESSANLSTPIDALPQYTLKKLRGLECNEAGLHEHIASFGGNKFIFVGLSHGNDEQLLTDNDVYVSHNNINSFANTLFYTSACSCCNVLGQSLLENGCLAFVGYTGVVDVWVGYYDIFIECENSGIHKFLLEGKALKEAVEEMKDVYNKHIDNLADGSFEDTIVAGLLVDNKSKLELLGDGELTIQDFIIQ